MSAPLSTPSFWEGASLLGWRRFLSCRKCHCWLLLRTNSLSTSVMTGVFRLVAQRSVKHALADSSYPRSTCVLRRRSSPIVRRRCAHTRRQLRRADRVHPGVRVTWVAGPRRERGIPPRSCCKLRVAFSAKETTIGRCMREPVWTARSLHTCGGD